jgi:hypothetical protein
MAAILSHRANAPGALVAQGAVGFRRNALRVRYLHFAVVGNTPMCLKVPRSDSTGPEKREAFLPSRPRMNPVKKYGESGYVFGLAKSG